MKDIKTSLIRKKSMEAGLGSRMNVIRPNVISSRTIVEDFEDGALIYNADGRAGGVDPRKLPLSETAEMELHQHQEKLDTIEEGAEVNQNAFARVQVGEEEMAAAEKQDAFELVAGENITLSLADKAVTITGLPTISEPGDEALYARSLRGEEGQWKPASVTLSLQEYEALSERGQADPHTPYFIPDGEEMDTGLTLGDILQAVYPVGSLFMSSQPEMPQNIAALGTWERLEGVFIAAASDTDPDFDVGDVPRGAKTVPLAETHLPGHFHTITTRTLGTTQAGSHAHGFSGGLGQCCANVTSGTGNRAPNSGSSMNYALLGIAPAGDHNHTVTLPNMDTTSKGGNTAHQNLPPYLARYIWERVE